MVPVVERDFANTILVVGVDANRGIINLPLGVAPDGATADNRVVKRLIERVAIVRIEIEADGGERVGQGLGLLAANRVEPGRTGRPPSASDQDWELGRKRQAPV